jgi:hypothetical protein
MAAKQNVFSLYENNHDILIFLAEAQKKNEVRYPLDMNANMAEIMDEHWARVSKDKRADGCLELITKLMDVQQGLKEQQKFTESLIEDTTNARESGNYKKRLTLLKVLDTAVDHFIKVKTAEYEKLHPTEPVAQQQPVTAAEPFAQAQEQVAEVSEPEVDSQELFAKMDAEGFKRTIARIGLFERDNLAPATHLADELNRILKTSVGTPVPRIISRMQTHMARHAGTVSLIDIMDNTEALITYLREVDAMVDTIKKRVSTMRSTKTHTGEATTAMMEAASAEEIFVVETVGKLQLAAQSGNLFTCAWLLARLRTRETSYVSTTLSMIRQIREVFEASQPGHMKSMIEMREEFVSSNFFADVFGSVVKSKQSTRLVDLKSYNQIVDRIGELWPMDIMRGKFDLETDKYYDMMSKKPVAEAEPPVVVEETKVEQPKVEEPVQEQEQVTAAQQDLLAFEQKLETFPTPIATKQEVEPLMTKQETQDLTEDQQAKLTYQSFMHSAGIVESLLENVTARNAGTFDERASEMINHMVALLPHLRVQIIDESFAEGGSYNIGQKLKQRAVKIGMCAGVLYKDFPVSSVTSLIGGLDVFVRVIDATMAATPVKPAFDAEKIKPVLTDLDILVDQLIDARQKLRNL